MVIVIEVKIINVRTKLWELLKDLTYILLVFDIVSKNDYLNWKIDPTYMKTCMTEYKKIKKKIRNKNIWEKESSTTMNYEKLWKRVIRNKRD